MLISSTKRVPSKILPVRRQRVMKRLIGRYISMKKIAPANYMDYNLEKFKNKTILIEAIYKENLQNPVNIDEILAHQ
jgi:hypothetical protein